MVHTRATEDAMLDILEGSAYRGRGRGQVLDGNPLPLLHSARWSALSSCWQHRMIS
jgi:hypothetical protein